MDRSIPGVTSFLLTHYVPQHERLEFAQKFGLNLETEHVVQNQKDLDNTKFFNLNVILVLGICFIVVVLMIMEIFSWPKT